MFLAVLRQRHMSSSPLADTYRRASWNRELAFPTKAPISLESPEDSSPAPFKIGGNHFYFMFVPPLPTIYQISGFTTDPSAFYLVELPLSSAIGLSVSMYLVCSIDSLEITRKMMGQVICQNIVILERSRSIVLQTHTSESLAKCK